MDELVALIGDHGLLALFAFVLFEQLGAPVPSTPVLVVAGAMAADGRLSLGALAATALAASMAGNVAWFVAGRAFGHRVLRTICRISLSPDTCVRQSEDIFERRGALALVAARFVPWLAMVAPPLAGAMGYGWGRFLFFAGLGVLLWEVTAIGAGFLFHAEVDRVLDAMAAMGIWALALVAALIALFVAWRWAKRQRLFRFLRMARIDVDELHRMMDEGHDPVIADVRSRSARLLDPRSIPGALPIDIAEIDTAVARLPRDREIVLYCNCPSEASAAKVAQLLMKRGFTRVRPLAGGLDAWVSSGFAVDLDADTPAI